MTYHNEHEAYALAHKVLAVAVICFHKKDGVTELIDWAVYVDAVPGHNHELEKFDAARTGDKIARAVACVLFPHLPTDKYRN